MGLLKYYWRVLRTAFSHSFSRAQDILFGLLILAGIAAAVMPQFHMGVDVKGWQAGAGVLGIIFFVRLLLAPYWIHRADQEIIRGLKEKLPQPTDTERISLIELFNEAIKYGLDLLGKDGLLTKLCDALRQSGLLGELEFFGRGNTGMFEANKRRVPLEAIPKEHWKKFRIDVSTIIDAGAGGNNGTIASDNFNVRSKIPGLTGGGFRDIHARKAQSLKWLERETGNILKRS